MIDFEGNELLASEYDSILALKSVEENFVVKKDGKVGLVNSKGQAIINSEYKNIMTLKEGYKNEYIIVDNNNKYGVISTSGTIILEPKYDSIKYLSSSEIYAVKENNKQKVINKDGTVLLEGYDDYIHVKGENITVKKDGKYGIVKQNKEVVIKTEYEDLQYAFSIYYIAKKNGKYGVINLNNEEVIKCEYNNISYIEECGILLADKSDTETVVFDNNLAQKFTGIVSKIDIQKGYFVGYVNGEYKYYNFKFEEKKSSDLLTANTLFLSKKDGKYGYVNKSGEVIVDYIYEDAKEQNAYGFAAVKQNGVWGCIDKAGKLVLEPSVNLDNSIFVDFIGTYHLSDEGIYLEK